MKTKINIDDMLTILNWVRSSYMVEGKSFNYQNLLDQAETYRYTNTPFDTKKHSIDELMIDAFRVYHKLKTTENRIFEVLDSIKLPMINKDEMIAETKRYESIFEDLMENCKFDDPEIRGIQKGILDEKMNEYVASEDYENAAKLRDMIKEC
jgi:hypothetical protein